MSSAVWVAVFGSETDRYRALGLRLIKGFGMRGSIIGLLGFGLVMLQASSLGALELGVASSGIWAPSL